jgi:hypothetical protein
MHVDALWSSIASDNLSPLYDLEFILSLHGILPLLDCVHALIKLAQFHELELYISIMIFTINFLTQLLMS